MIRRFLKLLLAGIVFAVAVCLALVYWAGIRPLPQTGGAVSGPGFPSASAGRDRLGVPHIQARSIENAVWVQGYVTAQDRLWQMDTLRRVSAGEVAEILGPSMIAVDRDARTLGIHRAALAAVARLPPADRALFEAYRNGVNAFLDSHRSKLPVEFRMLRYQPRRWEASDCLLVAMYMFRTLTTTWRDEIMKRALLERATPEQVQLLLPVRSGREVSPGSNAWVLSGAHTASGKPLFENDPHLDYSMPCIWHTVHLQAPGLNAIGVSVPGLPGIIIGHNDRIAWGATNLHFDVQDLYLSAPVERTEREVIHVKGAPDVVLPVAYTRYGPVVTQVGGQPASLHWTAADPSVWDYPFVDLDRARNWDEFRRALSRFAGPGQNWVYADVDGNIGYQAAGKLPIRRSFDGSVPVPGDGRFDWQGYIPFDDLPRAFNPPSGIIVTANQNPFPPSYPYTVSGNFASQFRSNRIRQLLEQRERFQAPDFLGIETDLYSAFAHSFAQALVAAIEKAGASDPALARPRDELRAWDGQFHAEQTEPVLATIAYNRFLRHLVENVAGERGLAYASQMSPAFIEQILAVRPPGWTNDYDALLLASLREALRELQSTPAAWGQYLETTLAHPAGHRLPVLRRWFDIGPFPQSGTTTTVKQTTKRMGPSMRLIVDLADLDRSLHNLTTGESGQPLSPHYKDQWDAYYHGRSFPLLFSAPEIVDLLTFQPGP